MNQQGKPTQGRDNYRALALQHMEQGCVPWLETSAQQQTSPTLCSHNNRQLDSPYFGRQPESKLPVEILNSVRAAFHCKLPRTQIQREEQTLWDVSCARKQEHESTKPHGRATTTGRNPRPHTRTPTHHRPQQPTRASTEFRPTSGQTGRPGWYQHTACFLLQGDFIYRHHIELEFNFTCRKRKHSLFHWSTSMWRDLLTQIWMWCKNNALTITGTSLRTRICQIRGQDSRNLL